jgi:hypothetical protein
MVANHQDPHAVVDNAIKKMKRKSLKVHSPNIAFSDCVTFRRVRSFIEKRAQLRIEFVSQVSAPGTLVIIHDSGDVGMSEWV